MPKKYEVTRLAVEMQPIAAEEAERDAIERQSSRWHWLSIATIVVSFVHMVAALRLFGGAGFFEQAAAFLMTGLVDVATWIVANYLDYAKRRNLQRGKLVKILFGFALLISCGLNLAYLVLHMPASLPWWIGWSIAVAFALFIPLCIAVASVARGELEDDKVAHATSAISAVQPAAVMVTQPVRRRVSTSAAQPALAPPDRDATINVDAQPVNVDRSTPIELDERTADWLALKRNGVTYSEIAARYGVSRQFVNATVKPILDALMEANDEQ